jgi:hypothetical protein
MQPEVYQERLEIPVADLHHEQGTRHLEVSVVVQALSTSVKLQAIIEGGCRH